MNFDPVSLHNAIDKGMAKEIVEKTKEPQPNQREKIVADLVEWITREKWSGEEINRIYVAARNRCLSKTCYQCGQVKPVFGATWVWVDGDMSKPKRFQCADCKGVL